MQEWTPNRKPRGAATGTDAYFIGAIASALVIFPQLKHSRITNANVGCRACAV